MTTMARSIATVAIVAIIMAFYNGGSPITPDGVIVLTVALSPLWSLSPQSPLSTLSPLSPLSKRAIMATVSTIATSGLNVDF